MRYLSTVCIAIAGMLLPSCSSTYSSKSYGRAFVTEAYKQGFYSRSTFDWEMDRIARMNIPEGAPMNQASIRDEVRNTFAGIARSTTRQVSPQTQLGNVVLTPTPSYGTGEVPSESFATQVVAAKIDGQSGGTLRLVSFNKTDGVRSVVFGKQHYTLEGQLTFAALTDTNWTGAPNVADETIRFGTTTASPERNSIDGARMFAMNETYLSAGTTRTLSVEIHFLRSEKGWRLNGITR